MKAKAARVGAARSGRCFVWCPLRPQSCIQGRIFDRGVVINVCRSPDKDWQKDSGKYNDEQGRYLNNRKIIETMRKIIDCKYPVSQGNCRSTHTLPANSVKASSFVHTRRISLTIYQLSVGLTRRCSRPRIRCRSTCHHFIVSACENADKDCKKALTNKSARHPNSHQKNAASKFFFQVLKQL